MKNTIIFVMCLIFLMGGICGCSNPVDHDHRNTEKDSEIITESHTETTQESSKNELEESETVFESFPESGTYIDEDELDLDIN